METAGNLRDKARRARRLASTQSDYDRERLLKFAAELEAEAEALEHPTGPVPGTPVEQVQQQVQQQQQATNQDPDEKPKHPKS